MTNTQRFISLAIEGGWRKAEKPNLSVNENGECFVDFLGGHDTGTYFESDILLDPLAWQAVGKVKWRPMKKAQTMPARINGKRGAVVAHKRMMSYPRTNQWLKEQHRFIDLLADGKSIEEALGEILR